MEELPPPRERGPLQSFRSGRPPIDRAHVEGGGDDSTIGVVSSAPPPQAAEPDDTMGQVVVLPTRPAQREMTEGEHAISGWTGRG